MLVEEGGGYEVLQAVFDPMDQDQSSSASASASEPGATAAATTMAAASAASPPLSIRPASFQSLPPPPGGVPNPLQLEGQPQAQPPAQLGLNVAGVDLPDSIRVCYR